MTHKMNFGFTLVFIKHLLKPAVDVKIFCTVMVRKVLRIIELKKDSDDLGIRVADKKGEILPFK